MTLDLPLMPPPVTIGILLPLLSCLPCKRLKSDCSLLLLNRNLDMVV